MAALEARDALDERGVRVGPDAGHPLERPLVVTQNLLVVVGPHEVTDALQPILP